MSPQIVSESDGSAGRRVTVGELLGQGATVGPGAHELLTVILRALETSNSCVSLVKGTLRALLSDARASVRAAPLDADCHLLAALIDETLDRGEAERADD